MVHRHGILLALRVSEVGGGAHGGHPSGNADTACTPESIRICMHTHMYVSMYIHMNNTDHIHMYT